MNITPQNNLIKFKNFILDDSLFAEYEYNYLEKYIDCVSQRKCLLFENSLINISEHSWILILHGETEGISIFHIYGENWRENQFQEISELFDLNNLKKSFLAGDSMLINGLIHFFGVKHDIYKERVFYKAQEINRFENSDLEIELGSKNDLRELSIMLHQYYNEEYEDYNRTITQTEEKMSIFLESESIFVSKNNAGQIIGFCTVNDPDIGILFTNTEFRNKGYGRYLLSICSEILKESNHEVYLMTDKEKSNSNKVVSEVGYKPFYDYIMTFID